MRLELLEEQAARLALRGKVGLAARRELVIVLRLEKQRAEVTAQRAIQRRAHAHGCRGRHETGAQHRGRTDDASRRSRAPRCRGVSIGEPPIAFTAVSGAVSATRTLLLSLIPRSNHFRREMQASSAAAAAAASSSAAAAGAAAAPAASAAAAPAAASPAAAASGVLAANATTSQGRLASVRAAVRPEDVTLGGKKKTRFAPKPRPAGAPAEGGVDVATLLAAASSGDGHARLVAKHEPRDDAAAAAAAAASAAAAGGGSGSGAAGAQRGRGERGGVGGGGGARGGGDGERGARAGTSQYLREADLAGSAFVGTSGRGDRGGRQQYMASVVMQMASASARAQATEIDLDDPTSLVSDRVYYPTMLPLTLGRDAVVDGVDGVAGSVAAADAASAGRLRAKPEGAASAGEAAASNSSDASHRGVAGATAGSARASALAESPYPASSAASQLLFTENGPLLANEFMYLTLPTTMPIAEKSASSAVAAQSSIGEDDLGAMRERDQQFSAHRWREGHVGKLRTRRSGRMELVIGDLVFDVLPGTQTSTYQQLLVYDADEAVLSAVGAVVRRGVVTPNLTSMLR